MRFADLRHVFFSSEALQFNCFQPRKVSCGWTWASVQEPSLWEQGSGSIDVAWLNCRSWRPQFCHLQMEMRIPIFTSILCTSNESVRKCLRIIFLKYNFHWKSWGQKRPRDCHLGISRDHCWYIISPNSLCAHTHLLARCSQFVPLCPLGQDRDCFSIQLEKICWPRSPCSLTPTRKQMPHSQAGRCVLKGMNRIKWIVRHNLAQVQLT